MAHLHALASSLSGAAGLIRSVAHTPYGELPCYARTRVSRRAADSGPPNKNARHGHHCACMRR